MCLPVITDVILVEIKNTKGFAHQLKCIELGGTK